MPLAFDSTVRKARELRDIFNKLRKKYRSDTIEQWLCTNYFISTNTLYPLIRRSDDQPVENPSELYKLAMSDNFHL